MVCGREKDEWSNRDGSCDEREGFRSSGRHDEVGGVDEIVVCRFCLLIKAAQTFAALELANGE